MLDPVDMPRTPRGPREEECPVARRRRRTDWRQAGKVREDFLGPGIAGGGRRGPLPEGGIGGGKSIEGAGQGVEPALRRGLFDTGAHGSCHLLADAPESLHACHSARRAARVRGRATLPAQPRRQEAVDCGGRLERDRRQRHEVDDPAHRRPPIGDERGIIDHGAAHVARPGLGVEDVAQPEEETAFDGSHCRWPKRRIPEACLERAGHLQGIAQRHHN